MDIGYYNGQVPGAVETSRRHPRGSISKEDCSCVGSGNWRSSSDFKAPRCGLKKDPGVFKGGLKRRKTPGKGKMAKRVARRFF